MKILHVFDFDDTLIHSDANVRIRHADGSLSSLSSGEYATYDEKPDDEMDFSDFESYPENAEIIEEVFLELQMAIAKSGLNNVVILTARNTSKPVIDFLQDNGIYGIDVFTTGSSNPADKANYIISRIKKDPSIDLVRVFEDNAKNIREIRRVLKKDGSVLLQTHRIVDGGISASRND